MVRALRGGAVAVAAVWGHGQLCPPAVGHSNGNLIETFGFCTNGKTTFASSGCFSCETLHSNLSEAAVEGPCSQSSRGPGIIIGINIPAPQQAPVFPRFQRHGD